MSNEISQTSARRMLKALKAIVERSEGKLYSTDQETGETFVNLAIDAIRKSEVN